MGALSLLLKILPNRTARLLELHVPIYVYVYKSLVHVMVIVHEHIEIHQNHLQARMKAATHRRLTETLYCLLEQGKLFPDCQLFVPNKAMKSIII